MSLTVSRPTQSHIISSASGSRPRMKPRPSPSQSASTQHPSHGSSTSNLQSGPTPSSSSSRHASMPPPPLPRKGSASSAAPTPNVSSTSIQVVLGKDTSSSAGKVFAKPSKEWVLPERAKPGRKVSADEPENKRQSQNRISQRAHRARKTDYVQTLEDKLRAYEADEIHSNVRLQEVARALKADNERLKFEVANLQRKVENLETGTAGLSRQDEEIKALREEIERLRAGSGPGFGSGSGSSRANSSGHENRSQSDVRERTIPRSESQIVRASSNINKSHDRPVIACPICPDPDPDCPCQQAQPVQIDTPPLTTNTTSIGYSRGPQSSRISLAIYPSNDATGIERKPFTVASSLPPHHASVSIFRPSSDSANMTIQSDKDCGICDSSDDCLCRIHDEEAEFKFTSTLPSVNIPHAEDDACGLCTSGDFCACREVITSTSSESPRQTSTIVPAVPLRARRSGQTKASVWALEDAQTIKTEATCSGDPTNCDACRNDVFGQEFCARLAEATSQTVHPASSSSSSSTSTSIPSVQERCPTCPGNCMAISSLVAPTHISPRRRAIEIEPEPVAESTYEFGHGVVLEGTMRCDQAWKTIKAHPKATFSSLAMLADVVARRTKCVGPRVELSPPPPELSGLPPPKSDFGTSTALRPMGRRLEVETKGVRDALRLLDREIDTDEREGRVKRQKVEW